MNRFVLFLCLLLFWVFLSWPHELAVTYLQDLGAGVLVSLLVASIMGVAGTDGVLVWLQPRRYFWAAVYVVVLAAYVIKANVEVAYRVLHPAMPIRPGIVKIKTRLQRPASRAVLCNSITLTPGTLAIDIRDDGTMMVHWIYVHSVDPAEATQQIIGRFEWFIEQIFE